MRSWTLYAVVGALALIFIGTSLLLYRRYQRLESDDDSESTGIASLDTIRRYWAVIQSSMRSLIRSGKLGNSATVSAIPWKKLLVYGGALGIAYLVYLWYIYIFPYNPLSWTVGIVTFAIGLLIIPFWVYFIAPGVSVGRGVLGTSLWIIFSMAMGGVNMEYGADGQYHAYPVKVDKESREMKRYKHGSWDELDGKVAYITRLGWRPFIVTWEKDEDALEEIHVPESEWGKPPAVERDTTDANGEPSPAASGQPPAVADGGAAGSTPTDAGDDPAMRMDEPDHLLLDRAHGGLDDNDRGHLTSGTEDGFRAFNPYTDNDDRLDGKVLINTRRVKEWMKNSARTKLIQSAKEEAIIDSAHTPRLHQFAYYGTLVLALIFGVVTAYFTV